MCISTCGGQKPCMDLKNQVFFFLKKMGLIGMGMEFMRVMANIGG